jgi:hypothetical protein
VRERLVGSGVAGAEARRALVGERLRKRLAESVAARAASSIALPGATSSSRSSRP